MANILYMQKLCSERNFAPAEVVEVLRTNMFGDKRKNGERDTAIMRDLANGLTYADVSESYHLSIARIKEIERSCLSRLSIMIDRRRHLANCVAIEDIAGLAEVVDCDVGLVQYVLANPTLCLCKMPDEAMAALTIKLQGCTVSNIATAQNITGEEAIVRLVTAVDTVKQSVRVVLTETMLWDSECSVRSVTRMCKQWDVTQDELERALDNEGAHAKMTEKGKAILRAWIEGKNASEACKGTNVPYTELNKVFKASWPILRERLRACKMERVRAEAIEHRPTSSPSIKRMSLGS